MGVLPVPDEIRAMVNGIKELVTAVKEQTALLEKIHLQMGVSQSNSEQLKVLRDKLDAVHGTLITATDSLRLLSVFSERRA